MGRIALDRVPFDTDEGTIKPASDPQLAEIAAVRHGTQAQAFLVMGLPATRAASRGRPDRRRLAFAAPSAPRA